MRTITPPRSGPAALGGDAPAAPLASLSPVARRRTPARRVLVEGRVLVTRPELARITGEREHTLYKWFADRENNHHPEGTEIDGLHYVDLAQWQTWHAEHSGDRRVVDGRVLLSRAELARRSKTPERHLARWWAERAENGHPAGVRFGRKLYHDQELWLAWYDTLQAHRRAGLTVIDRSGDSDELVGLTEAARVLGYTSTSTIPKYRERNQFVEPDHTETSPSGREVPRWRRRTLWDFADARTGRRPRRRHTVADESG